MHAHISSQVLFCNIHRRCLQRHATLSITLAPRQAHSQCSQLSWTGRPAPGCLERTLISTHHDWLDVLGNVRSCTADDTCLASTLGTSSPFCRSSPVLPDRQEDHDVTCNSPKSAKCWLIFLVNSVRVTYVKKVEILSCNSVCEFSALCHLSVFSHYFRFWSCSPLLSHFLVVTLYLLQYLTFPKGRFLKCLWTNILPMTWLALSIIQNTSKSSFLLNIANLIQSNHHPLVQCQMTVSGAFYNKMKQ